jgi:hypothetical protein
MTLPSGRVIVRLNGPSAYRTKAGVAMLLGHLAGKVAVFEYANAFVLELQSVLVAVRLEWILGQRRHTCERK